MARPVPEQPPACRRENTRRFAIHLLPPAGCVVLLAAGFLGWALLVFCAGFAVMAYGSIVPRARLFGPHVSRLEESQSRLGQVWITVDDGPDSATTPALLEILDRHQAKAGFFLIGDKAEKHPDLVLEIARRGHVIGNHSQTHPAASFWTLRPAAMWREVAGCQQTLTDILGTAPVWFRPPVGHHNLFLAAPLRALGLTMAMWTCRGFDGVENTPASILRRIERGLEPGAIVLLHDATPVCKEVLEGTLALLARRGLHAALPEPLHPRPHAPTLAAS